MTENKKPFIKLSNFIFEDKITTVKEITHTSKYIALYIKMAVSRNTLDQTLQTTISILMNKLGLAQANRKNVNVVKEMLNTLSENKLITIDVNIEELKKNDVITISFTEYEDDTFTKIYKEDLELIKVMNNIDLSVYFCLRRFKNEKQGNKAWISIEKIRLITGIGKTTILNSINKLKKLNLVQVSKADTPQYHSPEGHFINPHNKYFFNEISKNFAGEYLNYQEQELTLQEISSSGDVELIKKTVLDITENKGYMDMSSEEQKFCYVEWRCLNDTGKRFTL